MFKLIVTIECDICDHSFDCIAVSADSNPRAWDYLVPALEATAELHGWSLYSAHHCSDCVEDMVSAAEQPTNDAATSQDDTF